MNANILENTKLVLFSETNKTRINLFLRPTNEIKINDQLI